MTNIDHLRNQVAYILTTTQNEYGDQKESSRTETLVRFRYITDIEQQVGGEGIRADAMIWFDADENVSEGTIVQVDGKYWRIKTLQKARRASDAVVFQKAFVTVHKM